MVGTILCGGLGTRLRPLTYVTNKHLLPVYDKPMFFYPLMTLINCGIKDICIVCGEEYTDHFKVVLEKTKDLFKGIRFEVEMQKGAGGIAHALSYAERFANGDNIAVILGDNLFQMNFSKNAKEFKQGIWLFTKKVDDPQRFGVLVERGGTFEIVEKPKERISDLAVTGFYLYDNRVFDFIRKLKPSARGELEITDVNNWYIRTDSENCYVTVVEGYWLDCGNPDSLLDASNLVKMYKEGFILSKG